MLTTIMQVYATIIVAHMWPLVTSLRLRARTGDAKRLCGACAGDTK